MFSGHTNSKLRGKDLLMEEIQERIHESQQKLLHHWRHDPGQRVWKNIFHPKPYEMATLVFRANVIHPLPECWLNTPGSNIQQQMHPWQNLSFWFYRSIHDNASFSLHNLNLLVTSSRWCNIWSMQRSFLSFSGPSQLLVKLGREAKVRGGKPVRILVQVRQIHFWTFCWDWIKSDMSLHHHILTSSLCIYRQGIIMLLYFPGRGSGRQVQTWSFRVCENGTTLDVLQRRSLEWNMDEKRKCPENVSDNRKTNF